MPTATPTVLSTHICFPPHPLVLMTRVQTMTKNNARVAENALRAVQQDVDVINGKHEGVEKSLVVSTVLAAGFGHKEVP